MGFYCLRIVTPLIVVYLPPAASFLCIDKETKQRKRFRNQWFLKTSFSARNAPRSPNHARGY